MNLNLQALSDSELLRQTQDLVQEERRITTEVLWHLKEVESRMLHLQKGCHSLFDYCVRELKYSGAAASRRIQAMILLKELPETAQAIQEGDLNLSNVCAVQTFFNRETRENGKSYTIDEKRDLLQSVQNKSRRECDQLLATISPSSVLRPEKEKPITGTKTQISVVLDEEVVQKLKRIRELLAHQCPGGTYAEVIGKMADIVLNKIDPERKAERARSKDVASKQGGSKHGPSEDGHFKSPSPEDRPSEGNSPAPATPPQTPVPPAEIQVKTRHQTESQNQTQTQAQAQTEAQNKPQDKACVRREHTPAKVEHAVWQRDQGQCTFVDLQTGRRCSSRYGLQVDHIQPVCHGGKSEASNLRLLCFQHHKYESLRVIGHATMTPYLTRTESLT